MKLEFYESQDPWPQRSTRGFSMSMKVAIPEAGSYDIRFKYQGKHLADSIKVAFDGDEKVIPTGDWEANAKYEWNSSKDTAGNIYDNFAADGASKVTYSLEAKTYTVKFSITGAFVAGEWGAIDGLEIVKK